MSDLKTQISEDVKTAMRGGDKARLGVLRMLQAELKQREVVESIELTDAVAEKVMADARAAVKWPAGGRYIGDWREGEKLAQNGRGMTWTDRSAATSANGAQCYNCHQVDKKEISFGTIGPSLWNYGKTRGVSDPASPTAAPIVQYTWVKLWNSKAYSACSNMPRFGHARLLEEQQIRDIMALLLDPKSPVNQ